MALVAPTGPYMTFNPCKQIVQGQTRVALLLFYNSSKDNVLH